MSLPETLLAIPVWWMNGVLTVLYGSLDHLAEWVALSAGVVVLLWIDPQFQKRASDRPRRHSRGEVQTSASNAQYFTLATMFTWLLVSLVSRFPIPLIGAWMWWIGLLSIMAVTEERHNQLWWSKSGILIYAGLVLALRMALIVFNQVSPADWAGLLGSRSDAQVVLTSTRGNLATVGMLLLMVLYPVGYTSLLLNRFLRNPKPLYNIGLEAGDVIRRLRTRQ